jgi:hypothetical protein
MASWLQFLLSAAAFLVAAPLVAWLAHRFGSRAKGGVMLASVLLGFGAVLDQPSKRAIEATQPVKGSPENDEPPLTD